MEVYYDCFKCKEQQTAKDVTEEVPTPVRVEHKCENCGAMNFIMDDARQKWLEDRGLEVKNTSHPLWHVRDVKSVDDLQFEFSLVYQGHHTLSSYQVGYYSMALLFFQKWAVDAGFDYKPPRRFFKKLTATYNHQEGNSHHIAKDNLIGFFGTDEAVEAGMKARMAWKGNEWMTRDHFKVEEVDTGYGA